MSSSSLRADGRKNQELRRLQCDFDVVSGSDGSCNFSMGRTKVLAAVFGPQARSRSRGGGVGVAGSSSSAPSVELRVSWAPFATQERRERGRTDRFIIELENLLRATVEAMVNTSSAGQRATATGGASSATSEIHVKVLVLSADGGVRSCCVNAVTCAVGMANLPCGSFVVSCGCTSQALAKTLRESRMVDAQGPEGSRLLLDPNVQETQKFGEFTLAVNVIGGHQDVVSTLCDTKLTCEDLEACVEANAAGCKAVGKFVRKSLLEYMRKVATVSHHLKGR